MHCVRTTPLAPGYGTSVRCIPASGPEFTDSNLRVPTGHYFLVTDITVIPDGDQDVDAITETYLYNRDAEDESVTSVRLRNVTTASYGASYRVPYLVLPAGHYLRLVNPALSQTGISVRISGLLVTNVNFLPLVARAD